MKVEVGQVWTRHWPLSGDEQYTVIRVHRYDLSDGIVTLENAAGRWTYMSLDVDLLRPLFPEFWTFNGS